MPMSLAPRMHLSLCWNSFKNSVSFSFCSEISLLMLVPLLASEATVWFLARFGNALFAALSETRFFEIPLSGYAYKIHALRGCSPLPRRILFQPVFSLSALWGAWALLASDDSKTTGFFPSDSKTRGAAVIPYQNLIWEEPHPRVPSVLISFYQRGKAQCFCFALSDWCKQRPLPLEWPTALRLQSEPCRTLDTPGQIPPSCKGSASHILLCNAWWELPW